MKKLLSALFLSFVLVMGFSATASARGVSAIKFMAQRIDLSVATTLGNHTYIPLNIDGDASDHVVDILSVLKAFEDANPDVEVISWNVEDVHGRYQFAPYIFGIWIDHRSVR